MLRIKTSSDFIRLRHSYLESSVFTKQQFALFLRYFLAVTRAFLGLRSVTVVYTFWVLHLTGDNPRVTKQVVVVRLKRKKGSKGKR